MKSRSRRYTIVLTDHASGAVRRVTVSLRPVLITSGIILSLPVLIGLGAAWKAKSDVSNLITGQQISDLAVNGTNGLTANLVNSSGIQVSEF